MKAIIRSNEINNYKFTKDYFDKINEIACERQGYLYYKYPMSNTAFDEIPDIVVADKEYGVSIINIYEWYEKDISDITEEYWIVNGEEKDNPFLFLDDYATELNNSFQKQRLLRNKVQINRIIAFPLIDEGNDDLMAKIREFSNSDSDIVLFGNCASLNYEQLWAHKSELKDELSELFVSVIQGAGSLNTLKRIIKEEKNAKIGEAIKNISHKINVLAEEQHLAAIQIPDGPQRIRGMAGTGKTIILTMKAAYLHAFEPNAKILYTFHTQALYNQIRDLISMFYRDMKGTEPDWDKMLVRHSWGTKYKEGVYTRACFRNSIVPQAFSRQYVNPLDHVYTDLNRYDLQEEYDYVLIDEAQDLPASFFQVMYKLTKDPKRIIFAYDELQSLDNIETVDVEELFGKDEDGQYLVDFSKGTYGNGIEMDYMLKKSYRNPLEVLMLAHGLGLGIHNPTGYMQVIEDKKIWNSIGYVIEKGDCKAGDHMIIKRPAENSISVARNFYCGEIEAVRAKKCDSMEQEIDIVVNDIFKMVNEEEVLPHNIVVISLTNDDLKKRFSMLQSKLFAHGIRSIAPGFDVDRDAFGIEGSVTLSTVYKAKGNEAFIVYVMGCESIYDYVDFLEARNRAFTAFTRSKGWLVITGVGQNMEKVMDELKIIMHDIKTEQKMDFIFPDQEHIARKLSSEEHARRKYVKKTGERAITDLLEIDDDYLEALPDEIKDKLIEKLGGK
jgi:superfamily I DNA and RNA helicase